MNLKKTILIIFSLAVLGCLKSETVKKSDLSSTQEHKISLTKLPEVTAQDTLIRLERTPCYGNCPVYQLTLYGNGTVLYNGQSSVKKKGHAKKKISPSHIDDLIKILEKSNVFSISNDRDCEEFMTDYPGAKLTVRINEKENHIWHYYGCKGFNRENDLFKIETAIDSISGVDEWVGK